MGGSTRSCAARALDNAIYVASASQQGVYSEATFGTPGGVYGPDGNLISESVGLIAPGFPARWRATYGSTLGASSGESLEEICS